METNTAFQVPTRDQVSEENKQLFDGLTKQIGMVPNLYATMAISPSALPAFLTFNSRKSSLSKKEQEIVNLAVSAINGCLYCQSAHTVLGKMNGLTEDQTIEFRKGFSSISEKYNVLAQTASELVRQKGHLKADTRSAFLNVGYTEENLIDVIFLIGDKTITNYLYAAFDYPIDFPVAKPI